jgi:hypothetical protein
MASSTVSSHLPAFGVMDIGRRTNSLGVAKVDCHTCSALKQHCDRQRPRCRMCISNGRKCGGFMMDLTWKNPSTSRKATASPRDGCERTSKCNEPPPQDRPHFKFVRGRPTRKRRPKTCDKTTAQPATTQDIPQPYRIFQIDLTGMTHSEHLDTGQLDFPSSSTRSDGDRLEWQDREDLPRTDATWFSTFSPSAEPPPRSEYTPSQSHIDLHMLPNIHDTTGYSPIESIQSDHFELRRSSSDLVPFPNLHQEDHQRTERGISDPTDEYGPTQNSTILEGWKSIPTGVTYLDLIHKYGAILNMCKFLLRISTFR